MTEQESSVFRAEAVKRYIAEREQTVLPRWIKPRTFLVLWILLGLLLAAGLIVGSLRFPVYAEGEALVLRKSGARPIYSGADMLVFLPARYQSQLATGQPLRLANADLAPEAPARVTQVEDQPQSPAVIRAWLQAVGQPSLNFQQPQAVAGATWQTAAGAEPPFQLEGSVIALRVQLGTRRFFSMVPVLRSWFREKEE